MGMFINFLASSIKFSTVFLFGSTGETLTEKSGHLNLGTPGIICVGAGFGYWGGMIYANSTSHPVGFLAVLIPMLFALFGAGLMGLLFSFLTVTLRANQNVTGLMLTTFGVGLALFIKKQIENNKTFFKNEATTVFRPYFSKLFNYESLGWFGELFLSYGILVYLAIIIAIVASIVLKRTRIGLNIRAVGENAATADSAGINVTAYRYITTIIGTAISGLAGLFYVYENGWDSGLVSTKALGWLALAIVIFSIWKPDISILGSILFSALYLLPNQAWISGGPVVKDFIKMLPYVVTIVVLLVSSMRRKKETQPPQCLGVPYFREER